MESYADKQQILPAIKPSTTAAAADGTLGEEFRMEKSRILALDS